MTEPSRDPLVISDLSISFPSDGDGARVVDEVSLHIKEDETLGLVGESGAGKTLTALAIMGLLPPAARVEGGHIWLSDTELLSLPEVERAKIRGFQIAMIFQHPRAALNPLISVGEQVSAVYRLRQGLKREEARERAFELLSQMGISNVRSWAKSYPHQLSGGMCQRVMIAMMIACNPKLLIADEPTTSLDVTVASQIFELLHLLKEQRRNSLLLITHDLGVIAQNCNRVGVMHAGNLVEIGNVFDIFEGTKHPYTQRLLSSAQSLYMETSGPSFSDRPLRPALVRRDTVGCRYATRCHHAEDRCRSQRPDMKEIEPGHAVMCHLWS